MTMATLSIDRRFCGPPGSGNGGYTAGRLAALIGDPAEVTLRRPPPLETEMRVERAGPRLLLMHGDDLIAEGHLLFALLSCGYILFGVRLEEHDLADTHPEYRAYAAATPRFVPRPWSVGRR
jgi:hypothetical protein